MSTIAERSSRKRSAFTKHYLPGYTGFVPTKNDFFGMTAGEISKTIVINGGFEVPRPLTSGGTTHAIGFYPSTPDGKARIGANVPKTESYGNRSRYSQNWIGGPTHELSLQHVPGYQGHVPGMISENVFSKSYAKCTQATIGNRPPKGHDHPAHVRFRSHSRDEYTDNNFRRYGKPRLTIDL